MDYQDYLKYDSQFPGKDVIDEPLWDTQLYTSAATTRLQFFQTVPATLDLGNMRAAGILPAPEEYLVRAIRIFIKNRPESVNVTGPAAVQLGSENDVRLLINGAALTFTVGQKDYGIYPANSIPGGGGAFGKLNINNILIAGANVDFATNGEPHIRNTFSLAKPVLIKSQINFSVVLFWNAPVTITRNTNICVALDGDHIRAIQ